LGVFLFLACEQAPEGVESSSGEEKPVTGKSIFSGYAQKGPFINGSSVTISELDMNLDQTGRIYLTTIADNSGSFEKKNMELVSNYVALKADGYYFNEISGKTSTGQITLYALADIEDVNSANVNVLTHLEKPRVEYLVTHEKKSFSDAKKQAQREVLALFNFKPVETSSETLNLTDNAALLAMSCILQGYLSTGDMMELMSNISSDIKPDGILDDRDLGSKLMDNAYALLLPAVRNNLANKYAELGSDVILPDFESYIQSFMNSDLYPQTAFITYPATGKYGINILSDDVASIKIREWNDTIPMVFYSMKADIPEGMSLKIILKDGIWSYGILPSPPINWTVSQYNYTDQRQEFIATESGKSCDLKFYPEDGTLDENNQTYITIEYYENAATAPTKVKRLYFDPGIEEEF